MKEMEIPFRAKDSELKGWEYTIPEGMEAEIKDGKIVVREKESEDERIRTVILKLVLGMRNEIFTTADKLVTKPKVLAWLEKLRELFESGRGLYYYDGEKFTYCGYPATEENPYDFAMSQQEKQKEHQNESDAHEKTLGRDLTFPQDKDKNLDEIAQDYVEGVKEYNTEPTWDLIQTAVCYGYHLAEQKEQKPAEWKPQPESLEALMYAIEGKWDKISPTSYLSRRLEDLYEGLVNTYNVDESLLDELPKVASHAYTAEDIEKLKELKKKIDASMDKKPEDRFEKARGKYQVEWSEEDEKIMETLLDYYEKALDNYTCVEWLNGITYGELCDWLKSLSMRCPKSSDNWKPSEEQMKALEECGECKRCIKELYEHLKKYSDGKN